MSACRLAHPSLVRCVYVWSRAVALTMCAAWPVGVASAAPPPAPQLAIRPVDEVGLSRLLAAKRGKVVLLSFWATWCQPCVQEFPGLVRLSRKYGPRGLDVISVSVDDSASLRSAVLPFVRKQRPGFPVLIRHAKDDEAFINRVDRNWTGALPALFLFDKAGRKRTSFIGETALATVERAVGKLLAENPAAHRPTKAR